jgi:fibronectin type 3 domain-containing protein
MQTKQKSNLWKLLAGAASAAVVLLALAGCPNPANDNNGGDGGGGRTFAPEKPLVTKSQIGFEFIDSVNLKTVTDADASDPAQMSAVIALAWAGEGAISYNVYHSEESARPASPTFSDIKGNAVFIRNLEEETEYYIWIEAVNPHGKTVSDPLVKTTGKKGPQASGGVERGDHPRHIKAVPGDGSLTVSWDLSDRVGWYEVYYTPKDAVPHIDITATRRFKWDEAPYAANTAYKDSSKTGYTRAIGPYIDDDGNYTGYYVGRAAGTHGDTRPILGVDQFGTTPPADVEAYPPVGAFYKIKGIWRDDEGDPLVPYKPLDPVFASAIPWDGANNTAGTPGTPVKFYGTSVTITGLANGTAYDVWIRCPNTNGERGYGYISGTPGAGDAIPAPSTVQVFTPRNTMRNLIVSWSKVPGAENYRVYASKFDYTPNATMSYGLVSGTADTVYTFTGLASNTTYYVWVTAEKGGLPGTFGQPVTGKTGAAPTSGHIGDKTIAGTNHKVKTAVYVEVNDRNPLNAGDYVFEDGTYLFDYVILFAANIRNRNCALETAPHGCTKQGPHVHLNENVRHILENRAKYIKPLQDKGIKVLLGLLGDHDGIGFGTMSDADIQTFAADVKSTVETYQLDGVDFDDEWASKEDWDQTAQTNNPTPTSIWTYPTSTWGWPFNMTIYRDPAKGIVPGNGILTAPSQAEMDRMWKESGELYLKTILAVRSALGTGKIVTLYEYNTGRYITPGGSANGTATKDALQGAIDFALQPWYNRYIDDSANGLPRSIYSPFGMDLSGEAYSSQNGAPNPPIVSGGSVQASGTIYDYASRFKAAAAGGAPYNMLYFYGLQEGSRLLKRQSSDSVTRVTKEEYISMMSSIVFGQNVVVTADGGDYRKDW